MNEFRSLEEALAWIASQEIYKCGDCGWMGPFKDRCMVCEFNKGPQLGNTQRVQGNKKEEMI